MHAVGDFLKYKFYYILVYLLCVYLLVLVMVYLLHNVAYE